MDENEKKTHHPVTFRVPIKTWDRVEKSLLKEKQQRVDRKLNVSDFLVELINKAVGI